MPAKHFRYQKPEQIIQHLAHFLSGRVTYDLKIDPLGVYFEIRESSGKRRRKQASEKRKIIQGEQQNMSKRKRKLSNTAKRTNPKIRSVKKGRTVKLTGGTYKTQTKSKK